MNVIYNKKRHLYNQLFCYCYLNRPDRRMCVDEEIIFRENTPKETERTSNGLFCVIRDNCETFCYYFFIKSTVIVMTHLAKSN